MSESERFLQRLDTFVAMIQRKDMSLLDELWGDGGIRTPLTQAPFWLRRIDGWIAYANSVAEE